MFIVFQRKIWIFYRNKFVLKDKNNKCILFKKKLKLKLRNKNLIIRRINKKLKNQLKNVLKKRTNIFGNRAQTACQSNSLC